MFEKDHKEEILLQKRDGFRYFWYDFVWVFVICLAYGVLVDLFRKMIAGDLDSYRSDFPFYAKKIIEGYKPDRMVEFISRALYDLTGGTTGFNIYAALVVTATIVLNYLVISYFVRGDGLEETVPRWSVEIASVLLFFVGPVYFPHIHQFYNKGSFASYAWHSPTQQAMTLFSLIALLCFMRMYLGYEEGVSVRWWLATAATMFLSAFAKPSFIICMVPGVTVLFILELIAGGKDGAGQRFAKLFAMGCTLIPAGLYILWLNTKEFGDEALNGGEFHVIFGLQVLRGKEEVFNMFFFGMLFTIVIFAANYKRFRDRKYLIALILFVFGFLQWALFAETGARARDGNFSWGRIFATYYLALACVTIFLENIFDRRTVLFKSRGMQNAYYIIAGTALCMALLSQMNYFRMIIMGQSYYQ